jgi:rare lipoprotein A
MRAALTLPILAAALLGAAATLPASAMIQCGTASWYDEGAGTQAADGGAVDPTALAAAHPSLPFGTKVRVKNMRNGRETTVVINDRGPFTGGRIIDLTRAAAEQLAFVDSGVTRVRISTLEAGEETAGQPEKEMSMTQPSTVSPRGPRSVARSCGCSAPCS